MKSISLLELRDSFRIQLRDMARQQLLTRLLVTKQCTNCSSKVGSDEIQFKSGLCWRCWDGMTRE